MSHLGSLAQARIISYHAVAPVVSYLGVDNNALTMAGSVTVAGLSFGQSDATPSSRIDGVACGTVAWTSLSSILCRELSAPSSVTTEMTVGGLVGTRYPAFTFDCADGSWIFSVHRGMVF